MMWTGERLGVAGQGGCPLLIVVMVVGWREVVLVAAGLEEGVIVMGEGLIALVLVLGLG